MDAVNINSSAGISTGIDLALLVAAEYYGLEVTSATARHDLETL